MPLFSPNKETIRRICSLFKCNQCWLLVDNDNGLSLWVHLDNQYLDDFKLEVESWSGCKFDVYNENSDPDLQKKIKSQGQLILPVDENAPLLDIEKRRR